MRRQVSEKLPISLHLAAVGARHPLAWQCRGSPRWLARARAGSRSDSRSRGPRGARWQSCLACENQGHFGIRRGGHSPARRCARGPHAARQERRPVVLSRSARDAGRRRRAGAGPRKAADVRGIAPSAQQRARRGRAPSRVLLAGCRTLLTRGLPGARPCRYGSRRCRT